MEKERNIVYLCLDNEGIIGFTNINGAKTAEEALENCEGVGGNQVVAIEPEQADHIVELTNEEKDITEELRDREDELWGELKTLIEHKESYKVIEGIVSELIEVNLNLEEECNK